MQWQDRDRLGRGPILVAAVISLFVMVGSAQAETPDRPGIENPSLPQQEVPQQNAADSQATSHVEINNFDFSPMSLTVRPGTKVTWTNHDDIPHTVVSADDPAQFKSPPLDTDDAYSFVFAKPGTYKYFCSVHPQMVGIIVLTER